MRPDVYRCLLLVICELEACLRSHLSVHSRPIPDIFINIMTWYFYHVLTWWYLQLMIQMIKSFIHSFYKLVTTFRGKFSLQRWDSDIKSLIYIWTCIENSHTLCEVHYALRANRYFCQIENLFLLYADEWMVVSLWNLLFCSWSGWTLSHICCAWGGWGSISYGRRSI